MVDRIGQTKGEGPTAEEGATEEPSEQLDSVPATDHNAEASWGGGGGEAGEDTVAGDDSEVRGWEGAVSEDGGADDDSIHSDPLEQGPPPDGSGDGAAVAAGPRDSDDGDGADEDGAGPALGRADGEEAGAHSELEQYRGGGGDGTEGGGPLSRPRGQPIDDGVGGGGKGWGARKRRDDDDRDDDDDDDDDGEETKGQEEEEAEDREHDDDDDDDENPHRRSGGMPPPPPPPPTRPSAPQRNSHPPAQAPGRPASRGCGGPPLPLPTLYAGDGEGAASLGTGAAEGSWPH